MLTRLRLENFKAWADTGDIALKPITGFFGTNSSGKSSLIQALLLLKQTAESSDRSAAFNFGDARAYVDVGDFESVAHRHRVDNAVKIAFDWDGGTVDGRKRRGFQVAARMNESRSGNPAVVDKMSHSEGDAVFGMARTDDGRYEVFSENSDREIAPIQYPPPIDALVKCYGFPDIVHVAYRNAGFLFNLAFAFEKRLESVYYLGPIRAHPERNYTWAGGRPRDMGRSGEYAIDAILATASPVPSIWEPSPNVNLEKSVALWLKKLGLIHDFRVERIAEGVHLYQVKVRKSPQAAETLISDVGFGVSQILPALVLCFYAPEGSTVILEQPEIHLHPLAQAGLADALIDAHQNRGVQIIVESHSEHLLNRIQRRVAEETISQEDAALYFCSQGDNGASEIEALRLDAFGNIANWPTHFFGDQFGEIAAMSEARLKRRRRDGE